MILKNTVVNVLRGKVHFPKENMDKTLKMEDGNGFKIFRHLVVDHIDEERLASFGVSGGSLTAIIVAGFCDYIKAASGIGAPEYQKLATVWKNALGEQKRKTYTWTGLTNEKDVIKFLEQYAKDTEQVLPQIRCPGLLIHGADDFVTKAESGKEIAELIGENASYRIIPGDDHLCSNTIGSGLADDIFDWYAAHLK
jgi:cephalosporin-C deacetylase-like acetyl esterase